MSNYDLIFSFKFVDAPTLLQRLGFWLIALGCRVLGFEVNYGDSK